ncbi:7-cyano-7-deazaguanine synthase QueC [Marinilabiliaceae bacterium ANBcel2]|nr:7-cyano-7-deazaguanine synthase QueC [Marinilabiliaceae bacterium ANBcel2]
MKKAVILLSGGLDSTVALWVAINKGYELYTLSFKYGQKHDRELEAAKKISLKANSKEHKVISINMDSWGGSSLTDKKREVENGEINRNDIPDTYVPARNMIFLSLAASYAESINAQDIFIGVSEIDYSGYIDCRQSFITAMENAINMGTVMAVEKNRPLKIHTPFIDKTKAEEIITGVDLGAPLELTWSCYRGSKKPCGTCDSCLLRAKAFKEAGVTDYALKA